MNEYAIKILIDELVKKNCPVFAQCWFEHDAANKELVKNYEISKLEKGIKALVNLEVSNGRTENES